MSVIIISDNQNADFDFKTTCGKPFIASHYVRMAEQENVVHIKHIQYNDMRYSHTHLAGSRSVRRSIACIVIGSELWFS